jgi:hypothetical protein
MSIPVRLSCLCLVAALAACHLIDQRTFNPHAGDPPKPPAAKPPRPGPGAIVTIKYVGEPNYAASLSQSVRRALALKPNVLFTVQTLVPQVDTPEAQAAALQDASATGREIAEAIISNGADEGQVEQAVRTDPSLHDKEVQVFVR